MSKKMFMFWDRLNKEIIDGDDDRLLCVTAESNVIFAGGGYIDTVADRYTPLRCAQHAPELRDESTGETRQLMEGDVLGGKGIIRLIVFSGDALRIKKESGSSDSMNYVSLKMKLLGNALLNPSLVSNWPSLPNWPLLQERVKEWQTDQEIKIPECLELVIARFDDLIRVAFNNMCRRDSFSVMREDIKEVSQKLRDIWLEEKS